MESMYQVLGLVLLITSSSTARPRHGDGARLVPPTPRLHRGGAVRDTTLGRLPTDLYPLNYTVELQNHIYDGPPPFNFNGSVEITFEVRESTDIIYLNSKDLDFPDSSIEIYTSLDSPVSAPDPVWVRSEIDETLEFFLLYMENALVQGAYYVIRLQFSGAMQTAADEEGVWWDSYQALSDGSTKYIINTQYQPSAARTNFPCFDEPSFKAVYNMIIWRKDPDMSLSNMPLMRTEEGGDGWLVDYYEPSAVMCVYLVAYVIGEFEYMEAFTNRGVPIRVWARPDYRQDLEFANSICAPFQDWYEEYLGVEFPLPKQDHVAIPNKGGAMENWGLMLYGENVLLYNSSYDTLYNQRMVALYIGHEVVHSWFGDLVTCDWWDNTWLNEGFAMYFEPLAFDDVLGWSGDLLEFQQENRYIFQVDSRNTSVPVRVQIDSPWDASQAFSSEAYTKGGCIARMLYQVLGPDSFQSAINRYLLEYAYGNTNTDELWQVFTEQAEMDGITDTDGLKLFIKEKFDPWTDQRGYPLITINRTDPTEMQLTQTMFLDPKDQEVSMSPFGNAWYIPMTWTDQSTMDYGMDTKMWLNRDNQTVTENLPSNNDEWVLLNINNYDYYRVWYDDLTYIQLTDQLVANHTVIPFLSRYQLINDAFEISIAGYQDEVIAMDTTKYLGSEDEFICWDTFELLFKYQGRMLSRYPNTESEVRRYLLSIVDPVYDRLGWDNLPTEDNYRQATRALILELACFYGNADCSQQAQNLFAELEANPTENNIPPDQRVTVYCEAVRGGGSTSAWNFLLSQYDAIADSITRGAPHDIAWYLDGLACPSGDALLQDFIDATFDPLVIRPADVNYAWNALTDSPDGPFYAWQYLKGNWNADPVPDGVDKYTQFLNCVERFGNQDDVDEVNDFIAVNPPANQADQDAYDEALAIVNANKAWNDVNNQAFQDWMRENVAGV